MDRNEVLRQIKDQGVVAVIRADSKDETFKIVEACIEGGIDIIEITFTIPHAHSIIEELSYKFNDDIILGAGTALDSETARIALLSGANFVVSPYFNREMVKLCNRYKAAIIPGAMTIKETVQALEYGCDLIKLFPGELSGPKMLKAFKGPLPQANLMPTGGVDINNIESWIKAGADAVGIGGSLIGPAKYGDYKEITNRAKTFVELVANSRELK